MVDFTYRDRIIEKLKNGVTLEVNEIRLVEILLTLNEVYENCLDYSIGLTKENNFDLKTIDKRSKE